MSKILSLLISLILVLQSFSQNHMIKGKVTDEEGMPAPGVSVFVKGTRIGTSTDSAGVFFISVPSNATTLIISSVNFVTQQVAVADNVTVLLKPNTGVLNEVVVVAYGQVVKKKLPARLQLLNKRNLKISHSVL